MREKLVENAIKRNLKRHHFWFFKDYNSGHNFKGIPDIIGCGHNHFFAVEVKRPRGGIPTPVQLKNLAYIAKNGGYAFLSADKSVADLIMMPKTKIKRLAKSHPDKLDIKHLVYHPDMNLKISPKQAKLFWQHRNSNTIMIVK